MCKLNKALYGLKLAPRAWFDRLRQTLIQWGFHNSVSDSSLFYSHTNSVVIFVLVYVDDILITGNNSTAIHNLIRDLHTPSLLHLHQTTYASDLLHKTNMSNAKPCSTPMASHHKLSLNDSPPFSQPSLYQSTIGALQYLAHTRPDISYAVNKLSQFLHAPTTAHCVACKRILRYIKGTLTYGLSFRPATVFNLEGFSDADWATNLDDYKSMSGLCVFLGGNLITWSSKKQNAVSRSSTKSEYRALATTTAELVWIQNLLTEIGIPLQTQPPILWCDNIGAQALASNPVHHARTKHIEIDVHFIRNLVAEKKLEVRYVSSNNHQPADLFTKPLPFERFNFVF